MPGNFPTGVAIVLGSVSESPQSAVLRSEMERGVPKQRRERSDVLVSVPAELQFRNKAQAQDWLDWFYSAAGAGAGADWFAWVHPRTGQTVQARIKGGELGPLQPMHGTWRAGLDRCRRSVTFEYLQPIYP